LSLFVFLHDVGERGDDLDQVKHHGIPKIPKYLNCHLLRSYRCSGGSRIRRTPKASPMCQHGCSMAQKTTWFPVGFSEAMVSVLRDCSVDVRFTIYPKAGQDS
ncbi:MAG: hypothetical protein WBL79_05120, partial [Bacillota bacterium]